MVTLKDFIHILKSQNYLMQHNKRYHRKVLHAQQPSFEWSHLRISSTYSKVRTTLCSIINSTTGKYCSEVFIWMVGLVQHAKQCCRKVQLTPQLSSEWSHYRIRSGTKKVKLIPSYYKVQTTLRLTAIHFDFAPMSHRTSALGQCFTAFCNRTSKDSLFKDKPRLGLTTKPIQLIGRISLGIGYNVKTAVSPRSSPLRTFRVSSARYVSEFLICWPTPYSLAVAAFFYIQSQKILQAVYSSLVSDNHFSAQESIVVSDIGGSELTLSHDSFRSAQLVTRRFSCWEIRTGHARKQLVHIHMHCQQYTAS